MTENVIAFLFFAGISLFCWFMVFRSSARRKSKEPPYHFRRLSKQGRDDRSVVGRLLNRGDGLFSYYLCFYCAWHFFIWQAAKRIHVMTATCPVCQSGLDFEPWCDGSPSHEICFSCGIQFGYSVWLQ